MSGLQINNVDINILFLYNNSCRGEKMRQKKTPKRSPIYSKSVLNKFHEAKQLSNSYSDMTYYILCKSGNNPRLHSVKYIVEELISEGWEIIRIYKNGSPIENN